MKKVAILASDNMMPGSPDQREDIFELNEQMEKLIPAFADHDLAVDLIRWRDAGQKSNFYDVMLPLFVWDYFDGNEKAFLAEMDAASQNCVILNSPKTLRWNADKSYLDDLASRGAPVIDTINVNELTPLNVRGAFEKLKTDALVIKPQVGGGAWRQVLHKMGDPFPKADSLPPGTAMIQAFLPSVESEGEYSFIYFGGEYSHALIKSPKAGDYRIQSIYGGTEETYNADDAERAVAQAVLASLNETPLYARVDLLRGRDDRLKLIELELIEPYLYLPHSPGEAGDNLGAQNLAGALKRRLA